MDFEAAAPAMDLMREGGWMMWGLLVLAIAALATAVERAIVLRRAGRGLERLEPRLLRALGPGAETGGEIEAALAATRAVGGAAARVAGAALRRFERPAAELEALLERRARRELRVLGRRLGVLAAVAATAPLLGFLGTVTGLMVSFEAFATYGHSNPAMVAAGIREALTTSAAGLTVAVPAQLLYRTFGGRLEHIAEDMEAVGHLLLELRAARG